jgi:hypothetical protein
VEVENIMMVKTRRTGDTNLWLLSSQCYQQGLEEPNNGEIRNRSIPS